ncbi:MAG TPA: VanZ family protein [Planctomycetota bacterium]|nr:VanZ family protein [Planctomycetota bacterium]
MHAAAERPGLATRALRSAGRLLQLVPRRAAWLPALGWMGLILWASSLPGGPGPWRPLRALVLNLGHAPLFGVLALLAALSLPRRGGWPRLEAPATAGVLAFVLAFGVAVELYQHAVASGRDGSLLDVATDMTGAACALWVAGYLSRADAEDRGLWMRLAIGVVACVGAAALATWLPAWLPERMPGHAWL